MANQWNFTSDRVTKLPLPAEGKTQALYWDGKTPGLGLRVTARGTRSFIFETQLAGSTIRITIGDIRTWTVGKAQEEATRLKTMTDQGLDPRKVKIDKIRQDEAERLRLAMEAEAEKLRLVPLGEAWDAYIQAKQNATGKGKWSLRHLADHQKLTREGGIRKKRGKGETKPGILTPLLSLRLSAINRETVETWLREETARRPTQAALAYRLLRAFLSWAAEDPRYASVIDLTAVSNKAVRQMLPALKPKTDCLQREQLSSWFQEVRKLPPVLSAYLQTILLIGCRREELATLRWEDVDFRWNQMTIRDKVEGERQIPLTPYVKSLLLDLRANANRCPTVRQLRRWQQQGRDEWQPSPWVFASSASRTGRLKDPRAAHTRALVAAGLPPVSIHGLRRSFGSLSEWVEVPVGIVAQIMGHKPSAIAEKHYRVRPLDLLRMWHTKIEAWILEQASIALAAGELAAPGLRVVGEN